MTVISEDAAKRRFYQGLNCLFEMAAKQDQELDCETVVAVLSVMAYLGAYAYPSGNLYDLKQVMLLAMEPLKEKLELEPAIDKALELAEVFRRPWTEPCPLSGNTI